MKDRVLYFPHIRVPETPWFTRMLLYWDQVGSIIPSEYIHEPERLGEHTRRLIESELVRQVIPGMYVWSVPNFEEAFLDFLESDHISLDERRRDFTNSEASLVHAEKLAGLPRQLEEIGVAQHRYRDWFYIENRTAEDFMSYLAAVLGQIEEVESQPATDRRRGLSRLHPSVLDEGGTLDQIEGLRIQVLENILPAPQHQLDPDSILSFKSKHHGLLRSFRVRVERELVALAGIEDQALRARAMEVFMQEIEDQKMLVARKMSESGIPNLVFSKFCGLVAAVPGVSPTFKLVKAIYDAFGPSSSVTIDPSIAYAAYVQHELAPSPNTIAA